MWFMVFTVSFRGRVAPFWVISASGASLASERPGHSPLQCRLTTPYHLQCDHHNAPVNLSQYEAAFLRRPTVNVVIRIL